MREIVFKGKDWLGNWHIGSIVQKLCENNSKTSYYANSGMCNHIIKVGDYYIIDENGEGFWVLPETIGQYTGMTDKNGVKIFEGDIVHIHDTLLQCTKPWHEFDGYVDFVDGSYRIVSGTTTNYRWIDYEVEVIGNLHDNQLNVLISAANANQDSKVVEIDHVKNDPIPIDVLYQMHGEPVYLVSEKFGIHRWRICYGRYLDDIQFYGDYYIATDFFTSGTIKAYRNKPNKEKE